MTAKVNYLLALGALLSASPIIANLTPEDYIIQSKDSLSQKFYNTLSKTSGNILFSPLSVHLGLSLAYQGASGSTAQILARNLNLPAPDIVAEGYKGLLTRIGHPNNDILMAQKVYINNNYQCLGTYQSVIRSSFLSGLEAVNFDDSQLAATTINNWVSSATSGKIHHLISDNDIDNYTRLVLVNGIYVKSDWDKKFEVENTKRDSFFLSNGQPVTVEMMSTTSDFKYKYSEQLDAQLLELPFTNPDLSLLIVLPINSNSTDYLEGKLDEIGLIAATHGMYFTEVEVVLPRFRLQQRLNMKEVLIQMGFGEIFDMYKANFGNMIELQPGDRLYIDKILHEAVFEVNEEGAEAAAATGIKVDRPKSPSLFIANHPFLFFLRSKSLRELFAGRLIQP